MNKLVCLKTLMHITSCSRDSPNSRDCRDSRETLKYGTFGREKLGFRAMSQRIWKVCVASLLISFYASLKVTVISQVHNIISLHMEDKVLS